MPSTWNDLPSFRSEERDDDPRPGVGGPPSADDLDALVRAARARPARLIDLLTTRLVPTHADWCVLHIEPIDSGDDLPLPAPGSHVRHCRPELDGALRKLVARTVHTAGGSRPLHRVLRTGRPDLVVVRERGGPGSPAALERRRLRALVGVASVLLLPLAARGRVFGVLALGRGAASPAGHPRFDERELAVAGAFAAQAALALDHASLHRAARLAQDGLRDIQQGRDARISRLAHAMRGPLAPLRQGIELLRSTPDDTAGVLGTAQVLARQVDRLVDMVNELADTAPLVTRAGDGPPEDGAADEPAPASSAQRSADPDPRPAAVADTPSRPRVLIVDDNADAASTLSMLLRRHGFDPHVAHGGQPALDAAAAAPFAVALLDIGLPGMNGYELAIRLRQLDGAAAMLLIAMTGYDDGAARARSREAGFAHHFVKPVDLKRLLAAIRGD